MGDRGRIDARWAMGAVLLLAVALRWPLMDAPLTSDEAWTLLIRESPVQTLAFEPADPTPGLYYLLAKAVGAVSDAPLLIRWISLVANLGIIGVGFLLGRRAGGTGAGLTAAGVLAAMSLSIFTATSGRAYALAALAITLSAWGLMRWLDGRARGGLALYAAGAVAAFYSHPTAVFWIAPSLYLVARDALVERTHRRAAMLTMSAMALLALPEVWRATRPEVTTGFGWLVQPGAGEALWVTMRNLLPVLPGDDAVSLTVSAVASLAVVVLAASGRRGLPTMPRGVRAVAWALLTFPIWLWMFGLFSTPVFLHRALLPGAIGVAMLLAFGAAAGRSGRQAALRGGAIILLYALVGGRDHYEEDWERVRNTLARQVMPGDVIVTCPFWQGAALAAELQRHPLPLTSTLVQWHPKRTLVLGDAARLDADWASRWNHSIYRLDRPFAFEAAEIAPVKPVFIRPTRMIIVSGQCPPDEARAISDWLGVDADLANPSGNPMTRVIDRPGEAIAASR